MNLACDLVLSLTTATQHGKLGSNHMSLTQENIDIQSVAPIKPILLFLSCKLKKNGLLSVTIISQGLLAELSSLLPPMHI